jgi:hypothetical protein
MAVNPYQKLYISTDELISRFKPSLTSYFGVFINGTFGRVSNDTINFLAYEAVLPGTSLETTQVFGDRQGITETFANKRVYPPVDVSFYVDYNYDVLRFFEEWISTAAPNKGGANTGGSSSYQKFQYPSTYKKDVLITKFEREFYSSNQRLNKPGNVTEPKQAIYTLFNAYPTNLISLPVSYEQSNILRTTVTFNYDLYSYTHKPSGRGTEFDGSTNSSVQGPGTDSSAAAPGATNQVRPNSLLTQAEYNAAYAQGFQQTFGGADKVPTNFKNPNSQQLLDQYNQTQNK